MNLDIKLIIGKAAKKAPDIFSQHDDLLGSLKESLTSSKAFAELVEGELVDPRFLSLSKESFVEALTFG